HVGIPPVLQRQARLGDVLLAIEVQAEGPEILSRKRRHLGKLPVICMPSPMVARRSRCPRGHFAPPTSMVANPGPVAEIYCRAADLSSLLRGRVEVYRLERVILL